ITIERNADIGAHFMNLFHQTNRMRRTAILVDVDAVRLVVDGDDLRAQFPQRSRRNLVARAIGAIDHDAQTVQVDIARQRALGEFDIAIDITIDALGATYIAMAGEIWREIAVDHRLDLQFDLVGKLESVWAE